MAELYRDPSIGTKINIEVSKLMLLYTMPVSKKAYLSKLLYCGFQWYIVSFPNFRHPLPQIGQCLFKFLIFLLVRKDKRRGSSSPFDSYQVIFRSRITSEIPGGSANSQSCDVDFSRDDSFSRILILHAKRTVTLSAEKLGTSSKNNLRGNTNV